MLWYWMSEKWFFNWGALLKFRWDVNSIVSVALPKHFGMLSTCDQLVHCGNFSPVCSRTMYSAYQ
jgi:hypothetical protein